MGGGLFFGFGLFICRLLAFGESLWHRPGFAFLCHLILSPHCEGFLGGPGFVFAKDPGVARTDFFVDVVDDVFDREFALFFCYL